METIEGYDIIEKIGEGGMGQVFRAVHRRLDRPVAIKRLAPHLSHNQDMLRRFLQEARLQARLTHPNVVNIFDLIENEQGIFLVMEYVQGQTAREMLLGRGRLSVPEALLIAEGVLSGLAFMHKNGVVHRDIKPSNIMVSVSGTVKVTDFGIARLVNEETGLTRFGGGIGTLHYMAPELIKSGEVSFSIDIYSLGATLHELLSGAPPFTGATDLEIMMGHLEKAPPPLNLPGDDAVTRGCRECVATALAKNPADRFVSADAFLAQVRRLRELALATPRAEQGQAAAQADRPPQAETAPAQAAREMATSPTPVPSATDKATSPTPPPVEAVHPPDAASAPAAPVFAATPRVSRDTPATPPPAGKRKLLAAAAAACLVGLALFLALRPGSETSPPTAPPATAPAPAVADVDAPKADPVVPAAGQAPAEPVPAAPSAVSQDASAPQAAPQADAGTPQAETPEASLPAAPPNTAEPAPAVAPAAAPDAASTPARAETEPAAAPETPATPPAQAPQAQAPQDQARTATPDLTGQDAPMADGQPAPDTVPAQTPTAAKPQQTPDDAASDAQAGPAADPGATPGAAQTPQEPAPQQIVYIGENAVRLRANPDTESDILLTLDPGTLLTVWENTGDWIKVTEPGGQTGYVHSRLTAATPPAPEKSPAKATKPASRRPKKPVGEDQGWKIVK